MDRPIISPIPDRMDIALIAEVFFSQTGNAIEVGVWEGEFAQHNLKSWKGDYYLCDTWCHRPDGSIDKNMEGEDDWKIVKANALLNCSFAQERIGVVQQRSIEAAKEFTDGFFDWGYIDALHDCDSVFADMEAWWPKLRVGGLFSGDDYGTAIGLMGQRWKNKYSHYAELYNWGVIEAVRDFCHKYNQQHSVTWMNDRTECPAWYIIKQ